VLSRPLSPLVFALIAFALALAATACGDDDDAPSDLADAGSDIEVDARISACFGVARQDAIGGWSHVDEGTPIEYATEPPTSGPHYQRWARYQAIDEALPRGHWVHNLEHGAVVLLHRPDADAAVIDALRAAYDAIPDDPACGHKRALLVPDADLESQVAAVAAGTVLAGDCVDEAAILDFVAARRGQGPEDVCTDGFVP
jgi:hypothetical protein